MNFTHVPECPVRKIGDEWHSVQGSAPLRNPEYEEAMGVSPWSFTTTERKGDKIMDDKT
jgi:hypothetical protein